MIRRALLVALPILIGGIGTAAPVPEAERPFRPAPLTVTENRVPLRVSPVHNLQLLDAKLNGVPCTLLLDTGASHTTFSLSFLREKLPELPLQEIELASTTNVTEAPKCFAVGALTLGSAELTGFLAMALPLDHLSEAVGERVDGILGMNTMAYAPFRLSLRDASVTWYPTLPEPDGSIRVPVLRGTGDNAFHLIASRDGTGRTFPVLVDSGASMTFMDDGLWPAAGEANDLTAAGVNSVAARSVRPGKPGALVSGRLRLPIRPLLSHGTVPILGADMLRTVDLYVDVDARILRIKR